LRWIIKPKGWKGKSPENICTHESTIFSGLSVYGQWAMGNGQWSMVNGQWSMGNGQWAMGNGQWAINSQQRKFGY
jgi:hypothetical protein